MPVRVVSRRYGDQLLALFLAVAMTVEVILWQPPDLLLAVPAALLATAPLAVRRTAPLAGFLLVVTGMSALLLSARDFDNSSIATTAVLILAPYSLGRHATGPQRWLGGLAVLSCSVLFDLYDNSALEVSGIAAGLFFVAGPWAAGTAIRMRHHREVTLIARTQELERDQAEHARQAVATERARIARELHDVVAHAISVTVLQARGARRQMESSPSEVRLALDAIEQTNTAALSDMRRLLAVLRDTEGASDDRSPQPGLNRLDSLIDHVRDSGVPVTVEVLGNRSEVPPGVDLSAYRIVQEALTNVIKHAGENASATVILEYQPTALTIQVRDNGVGANKMNGKGHGLIGIHERVAVVGGEVTSGAGAAGGFEVHARLPYALETA